MSAGRPILVTGSHRSGSTWVGRMLAQAQELVYLHEPFNADYSDPGTCGARFEFRFTYVTAENEAEYFPYLRKTTRLEYNWSAALRSVHSWAELQTVWRAGQAWRRRRAAGNRLLIKDPLALLSAPWLAERFGAQVVVLIRHPAAFVSSIKRFDWRSPLAELLAQPLLLRDYLHPFAAEIAEYAQPEYSVVEQAAIFWKMLYFVVGRFQEHYADWFFVRHEDISRHPQAEFERLFAFLALSFTPEVAATIETYTRADNPSDTGENFGVARVDSRANIWSWRQRLSAEEIATVRRLTRPVAREFYADADW